MFKASLYFSKLRTTRLHWSPVALSESKETGPPDIGFTLPIPVIHVRRGDRTSMKKSELTISHAYDGLVRYKMPST
jgi:hypothetical protein